MSSYNKVRNLFGDVFQNAAVPSLTLVCQQVLRSFWSVRGNLLNSSYCCFYVAEATSLGPLRTAVVRYETRHYEASHSK